MHWWWDIIMRLKKVIIFCTTCRMRFKTIWLDCWACLCRHTFEVKAWVNWCSLFLHIAYACGSRDIFYTYDRINDVYRHWCMVNSIEKCLSLRKLPCMCDAIEFMLISKYKSSNNALVCFCKRENDGDGDLVRIMFTYYICWLHSSLGFAFHAFY